jgi:hypothetical protein
MPGVLVYSILFLFFLVQLRRTFSNYTLSWDDADYLRVTSCFAHSGLNILSQNSELCESLIYKSPIFLHLGSLFSIPFQLFSFTVPDQANFLIEISLGGLFLLNMFLLAVIFFQIRSTRMQSIFVISSIFLFKDSFTLFMTDVTASLLAGLMVLSHLKYRSFHSAATFFWVQFALFIAALGTRTTCAPLIVLVFFAGYNFHRKEPAVFLKALYASVCISIAFSFILLKIWKPVLPSAWAMFGGNQSNYFGAWVRAGKINLTAIGFEKYWQILLIISLLLLITFILRNWRSLFDKVHLISILPSFVVATLYAISESKDSRFLMWPLFSIALILLINLDQNVIRLSPTGSTLRKVLVLSVLTLISVTYLSISTSNKSNYGLKLAKDVYGSIPNEGSVCPLTDSPELNISKILLVDSLNGNAKSITSRIVNIPDSAMNGLDLNQVIMKVSDCDFSYAESRMDFGGMKNEYTLSLTNYLISTKGGSIKFQDYLVIYDKRQSRIASANE